MKPHTAACILIAGTPLIGCKQSNKVRKERFGKECIRYVTHGRSSLFQELAKSYCDCIWETAVTKFRSEELDRVWNNKAGIDKLKAISKTCDTSLEEKMHSFGWPTKAEMDSTSEINARMLKNAKSVDDYLDSISLH